MYDKLNNEVLPNNKFMFYNKIQMNMILPCDQEATCFSHENRLLYKYMIKLCIINSRDQIPLQTLIRGFEFKKNHFFIRL